MAANIVVARPPIYDQIAAVFPAVKTMQGVIYCWGTTIYNPDDTEITPWLRSHEAKHAEQQLKMGVEVWWDKYLVDVEFRFFQELPAHHAEYRQYYAMYKSWKQRDDALHIIAERLSGVLYGNMVPYSEARRLVVRGKL